MDATKVSPANAQETGVPELQTSLMEKWDALDEGVAKLKSEADQKLFELTKNAHGWIAKQNLSWLVSENNGRFTVNSPANVYHFKTVDQGKELFLELENRQTYVATDQTPDAPQQLWENDLRVRRFSEDPAAAGSLLGTTRFHYRLDGLTNIEDMKDSLGAAAYYPADARDFDYSSEHDEYAVADILYDQDDNMVDMVRIKNSDLAKRKDPFVEGEKTLQLLSSSQLLGRFDPYTKQRLPVESAPQVVDAQTQ